MFAAVGGPSYYSIMGRNNLAWMSYFVDRDGCPAADSFVMNGASPVRGGWQQDAHFDVLHNFVDAANTWKIKYT